MDEDKTNETETIQIDLNGRKIDVETEVVTKTTLKFYSPWHVLSLSETAQDKIKRLKEQGDDKKRKNYIATHMKPRYDKLPDGKEGAVFEESIKILMAVV